MNHGEAGQTAATRNWEAVQDWTDWTWPEQADWRWGAMDWRPMQLAGSDRDPVPTWDGQSPEKNLKSYLRALRFWRRDTVVPEHRQGVKLYKSLSTNGELRAAVDLLDEEVIMGSQGWEAIV